MTARTMLTLAFVLGAAAPRAAAQEVIRHRTPGSSFPIAAAVEVPAGKTTVYVSGMVPRVTNEQAPRNSIASFGDTRTQTVSVLQAIEQALQRLDLALKDVVKMQVFLVADPAKENRMDFAGFMEGYTQFFGTAQQPNLPVALGDGRRWPGQSGLAGRDRGHGGPAVMCWSVFPIASNRRAGNDACSAARRPRDRARRCPPQHRRRANGGNSPRFASTLSRTPFARPTDRSKLKTL